MLTLHPKYMKNNMAYMHGNSHHNFNKIIAKGALKPKFIRFLIVHSSHIRIHNNPRIIASYRTHLKLTEN